MSDIESVSINDDSVPSEEGSFVESDYSSGSSSPNGSPNGSPDGSGPKGEVFSSVSMDSVGGGGPSGGGLRQLPRANVNEMISAIRNAKKSFKKVRSPERFPSDKYSPGEEYLWREGRRREFEELFKGTQPAIPKPQAKLPEHLEKKFSPNWQDPFKNYAGDFLGDAPKKYVGGASEDSVRRTPTKSIKKKKKEDIIITIPIDAVEYEKHGRVVLVKEMVKNDTTNIKYGPNNYFKKVFETYPVPVAMINGLPCYSPKQLNHLYALYDRGFLSDYLTDINPVYDDRKNVIGFEGDTPWYICDSTESNVSKYYSEQEFTNKFGHTFKVRRGVLKVKFIRVGSCSELAKDFCLSSCKWDDDKNQCISASFNQRRDVWNPKKNDTKWRNKVKDAFRDIKNLLKMAPLNSTIYQRVRNYHMMKIREYLNKRLDPVRDYVGVPKPKKMEVGDDFGEMFVNVIRWNGVPQTDRTYLFVTMGLLGISETSMDIMRNPKKYFPGYVKYRLEINTSGEINEMPQETISPVEVLRNMHYTHRVYVNEGINLNIGKVNGNVYDVLNVVASNKLKLAEKIQITPRDVIEYLGDSYYQFVEYKYGFVINPINGRNEYLQSGCNYQPVDEYAESDYIFNNKYYVVANKLWSNSVSTNVARRLAFLFNINLAVMPPCFSAKPGERIHRENSVITENDIDEYFNRDGKRYEKYDYPENFKQDEKTKIINDIVKMKGVYKDALIKGIDKVNINPVKFLKFNRGYFHYLLDIYKNLETKEEKNALFETIQPPTYFNLSNIAKKEKIFKDFETKWEIPMAEWLNPNKRPLYVNIILPQ